jgi:hypothetical protein
VTLSLFNDESGLFAISLEAHGPLAETHFRFNQRVNAVYGKNGAGKTWLLRSAHRALNGLRGDHGAFLYYRMEDDILTEEDPYADAIQYALLRELSKKNFSSDFVLDMVKGVVRPEAPLSKVVEQVLRLEHGVAEGTAFFHELLSSREFVLQPRGVDQHEWRVYAAVSPSSDTPSVNALIAYLRLPEASTLEEEDLQRRLRELQDSNQVEQERKFLDEQLERLYLLREETEKLEDRLAHLGINSNAFVFSANKALNTFPTLLEQNLPIPLLFLCDLQLTHGFSILVGEDDPGLGSRTLNAIEASVSSIVEAMDDSEVYLTSDARQAIQTLSGSASGYIEDVLGAGAPALRCAIPGWRSPEALIWEASPDDGDSWFRFHELGSGQRRWAIIAAQLAVRDYEFNFTEVRDDTGLAWYPYWQSLIFIDEPEAGLHPAAQHAVFNGLAGFPKSFKILVGTHSVAPFARRDVTLWYLQASEEGTSVLTAADSRVGELLAGSGSALSDLGLDRTGALQVVATVLLVEGEHDLVVLRELIGEELDSLHVARFPIRGTKALGAASVELFLQFTNANICFALDNDKRGRAEKAWRRALAKLRDRDSSGARHSLDDLDKFGTDEQAFLKNVCRHALKMGYQERLRVTGWSEPDVICLLPVKSFLPEFDFDNWKEVEDLREPGENIKITIKRLRGKHVGTDEVKEIARGLDYIPKDLSDLLVLLGGI